MTIRMAKKMTSNVVGRKMVLIPWKIVIGKANWQQTARVCLNQGG